MLYLERVLFDTDAEGDLVGFADDLGVDFDSLPRELRLEGMGESSVLYTLEALLNGGGFAYAAQDQPLLIVMP